MHVIEPELTHKVALITGASSGIGQASAFAFAQAGCKLILAARREVEGQALVETLRQIGTEAYFIQTDVLVEDQIKRLIQKSLDYFGRLDIAFNNAGTEGRNLAFTEQTNADYELAMNTNVRGVWWSMQHQIPAMLATGGGTIINNASIVTRASFANTSLYTASKQAVLGLSRVAALEYGQQQIRVNTVSPGITETPMLERLMGDQEAQQKFMATTSAQRTGKPEEIAAMVVFLASQRAQYINGQDFVVDGGYTL